MEFTEVLTVCLLVVIFNPETTICTKNTGEIRHICKFEEKFKQTSCKIKIVEKDGIIKKKVKCTKNRGKTFFVKDYQILPSNIECKGLVFNISLKVGKKKTKLIDVSWQRIEEDTQECALNLENRQKNFPEEYQKQIRNSNNQAAFWMRRVLGGTRINEMSIPGTHDTMSYKGTWATNWHLCQSVDLRSQLERGARFFDIRLGVKDGRLGCFHGNDGLSFLDSYFSDVMATFKNFLNAHPSEGIIFRYKNEREENGWFCRFFTRVVQQYDRLGLVWKTGSNFDDDLGKNFPTLSQIRKKIVILRIQKDKRHDCCDYGYWFDVKELDNYEGGGENPITGRPNTEDMTDAFRKKRSLDTEDNTFYNETLSDRSNHSLAAETIFNLEEDAGENQSEIAEANITEAFIFSKRVLDVDEAEITRIKNKNPCNMTEYEKNIRAWYCVVFPPACVIQEVVHAIYKPSTAYKNELTNMVNYAMTGFRDDMIIIYASAYEVPQLDPKGFAEGVNPHLRSYLYRNPWRRTGVIMFDFFTNWHNDIFNWILYRNMQRCAVFYEHGYRKGRAMWLVGESNNLVPYGFNDKISSVWIAPGCRVYMYQHANFQGRALWNTDFRTYAQVINDLWNHGGNFNDYISSVRCECYEFYLPYI